MSTLFGLYYYVFFFFLKRMCVFNVINFSFFFFFVDVIFLFLNITHTVQIPKKKKKKKVNFSLYTRNKEIVTCFYLFNNILFQKVNKR